jgi:glycosidase
MFSVVGEDFDRYKMNIVFLMTMPRIPQFYTGDEILMTSPPRSRRRSYRIDFPGGWAGDKVNAFTGAGLTGAAARGAGAGAQAGHTGARTSRSSTREADALRPREQHLGLLPL